MFTESYTKASADFRAWLDYYYRDIPELTRGTLAAQHGSLMAAALSANAETASTLKGAQLEIKTLRDRLDDAERRAHRAESDLIVFQGSVDASHDFLNEYLGTPESHEHGPVTSRIKALLEAKDKFISDALVRISDKDKLAAGQDKRIAELEAKVAKLDADTAIDLQVYALSQADKMRLKMLEHAFRNVDELLTKHGVSRDGYVTQKIERLIAYKDKQIADADAQVRSVDSQRYMAEATLRTSIDSLRCFIASPDVNTSDLQAMIKHVKWIISETHDAIRAAGFAFGDICGTQIIVNKGLPADRIRELVSETLAKAADAKRSGLLEQSEAWIACVNQLRLGNPNYSSASGSGLERAINEIKRLQAAALNWAEFHVTWESIYDALSAGNPNTFLQAGTGRANALAEIKRLQTEAAKPKVMAVDFETYRDPLRVAYETSPSGAAAATSIAADNQLENQKRETAKWKRAARAHASGLASVKRVLDSVSPFDPSAEGVAPVSASLVDRIRALAKDRDILKSMEAANRTLAKELETAHQARLAQLQEVFSAKVREADALRQMMRRHVDAIHAELDKSRLIRSRDRSFSTSLVRVERLVSESNHLFSCTQSVV